MFTKEGCAMQRLVWLREQIDMKGIALQRFLIFCLLYPSVQHDYNHRPEQR
jgi:hypothetical protein